MNTTLRSTITATLCLIAACSGGDPQTHTSDQAETSIGQVSPVSGTPDTTATPWSVVNGAVLIHGRWDVPLVFPVGQPLPAVSAIVRDNTGTCATCLDGDSVAMVLISSVAGQLAQVVSAGSSGSPPSNGGAGTGPTQTLTIPASSRIVAPGELFMLQFQTLGLWNNPSTARDMIGMITVGAPAQSSEVVVMMPTPFPGSSGPKFAPADNPAGVGLLPVLKSTFTNVGGEDFPLPFTSGRTITGVTIELFGQGSGMVEVDLGYGTIDQPSSLIGSLLLNVPPSWHRYVVPGVVPTPLSPDGHLIMSIDPDQTVYVGRVALTFN